LDTHTQEFINHEGTKDTKGKEEGIEQEVAEGAELVCGLTACFGHITVATRDGKEASVLLGTEY
jgi:hypothetical protein